MDKILYKMQDFEGPLDLLLHLIEKNKLDIKNIKISDLLDQYINHLSRMEKLGIKIKSEFLDMVSRLIYIKTVSILPKDKEEKELENELSCELIEHKKLKEMANLISEKINFDSFVRLSEDILPNYEFRGIINAHEFKKHYMNAYATYKNSENTPKQDDKIHQITSRKIVSVYSTAISILRKIKRLGSCTYFSLFDIKRMSKSSMVARFLAILELIKSKRIEMNSDIIKLK